MGYDSRFYIVEKSSFGDDIFNGMKWAEIIGMYEMCNAGSVSTRIKGDFSKTNVYIYQNDEPVLKDAYGDPLIEIPVPDMIQIMEEVIADDKSRYRRFLPFLSFLKGFDMEQWRDLVVLHYGH